MLNIIDHTLLKNTTSLNDIIKHCEEAIKMGAYSVCVNPCWVRDAKELLYDSPVKVCTVVGFPLGATPAAVKAFEAQKAVEDGADEIDMVINIGFAKSRLYSEVLDEIVMVKCAIGDTLLKVIVETSEFNEKEKDSIFELVAMSGVEYIKTSTGTTSKGATVEDVKRMVEIGKGRYKVKASGGINNLETLKLMVDAGADRIGTSGGLRIQKEIQGVDVSMWVKSNY